MRKQILLCTLVGFLGIYLPIFILGLIKLLLLLILQLSISKDLLGSTVFLFIFIGFTISWGVMKENNYFKNND